MENFIILDIKKFIFDIKTFEYKLYIFSCSSKDTNYGFEMELYEIINKEESKWNTKGRNVIFNLSKKDKGAEWWPRLTKDKTKN